MTTTDNMPPLPEARYLGGDKDYGDDVWGYGEAEMHAYYLNNTADLRADLAQQAERIAELEKSIADLTDVAARHLVPHGAVKWCDDCEKAGHTTAECWGRGTVAVQGPADPPLPIYPHPAPVEAAAGVERDKVLELMAYASSQEWRRNHVMSKAQYDNCLPKNRVDFDVPLYALKSKAAPAQDGGSHAND